MLSLTATQLNRFMACEGHLQLDSFESGEQDNTSRDEGNAADWVVAQIHSGQHDYKSIVGQRAPNDVFITDVMVGYLTDYIDSLEPDTAIEYETTYRVGDIYEVRGRTDSVWYDAETKTLYDADLKYGRRIVEAYMNWTLLSHARGWMLRNPDKPVEHVVLTIYQPRAFHYAGRIRSWELTIHEFDSYIRILHETLSQPKGVLHTGEHCKNCPKMVNCPAWQKTLMSSLDVSETAFNSSINNTELSALLSELKRSEKVIKETFDAYKELAEHRRKTGQVIANWHLTTDLADTSWKEYVTAEYLQLMTGQDLRDEPKLKSPTAAKTLIDQKTWEELTERKTRGVKLVNIDDQILARRIFEKPTKRKKKESK